MSKEERMNVLVLILIIIIDFIGFTLIFPIIPDLLLFYLKNPINDLDFKIIDIFLKIDEFVFKRLMVVDRTEKNVVLIIGSILSSLFAFLQFFSSPFWGRISDFLGRKKTLIITSIGLQISYFLWLFSKSFSFFLFSRILGGLMAGNISVAFAAIVDLSTENKRMSYMGLMGMSIGLGFVVGPILGGMLSIVDVTKIESLQSLTFLHPFSFCSFGSFLLALLSLIINIFYFRETNVDPKKWEMKKIKIWSTILGVINPFKHLVRSTKKIQYISFINLIYMIVFTAYEFIFTFFYKFEYRLEPYQLGLVFFYLGFFIAIWQGILPRILSGKFSEIILLRLGILIIPITFILQPLFKENIFLSLVSLIPFTFGNALVQPSISTYASKQSKKDEKGYVMGVVRSMGSLARAFGPLLGGILYWLLGAPFAFIIFAFLLIVVALFTFIL